MIEIFKNEQVRITKSHDCIQWYDLKDKYNEYQGYAVTTLLDKFKLKPRTFCGMD